MIQMRLLYFFILPFFAINVQAQVPLNGSSHNYIEGSYNRINLNKYDSSSPKKWEITPYAGITSGYSLFNRNTAYLVGTSLGIQLGRRLSNNVYAFAAVSTTPMYINFDQAPFPPVQNKFNTLNSFYQPGIFSMYSSASMGIMYINSEKTFSVSGSISVGSSSYPGYLINHWNNAISNKFSPAYQ